MATSVSRAKIWLIGKTMDKFNESKLPSRGEVLKVLFEFHSKRGLNFDGKREPNCGDESSHLGPC